MYSLNPYIHNTPTTSLGTSSTSTHVDYTTWALHLYRRVTLLGWLGNLWSKITRRPSKLLDLNHYAKRLRLKGRHYAGIEAVSIHQIRGTQGKEADFNASFAPLNERTRSRWLGIAIARLQGTPLPPVELIQVGQTYFVVDGHHRISVAKALGEQIIDAEVTKWNASGPLPWEKEAPRAILKSQIA